MSTSHEVVLLMSNKKVIGDVYIAKSESADVFGKGVVSKQERISQLSQLRGRDCFQNASREVKDIWKNRLLKENKSLFAWTITGSVRFEKPLKIQGKQYFRSYKVPLNRLTSQQDVKLPSLDLKETALYFMNLLDEADFDRLKETMASLDHCIIKVGSTCSGTDIAASVVKATFAAFAEHFHAPWQDICSITCFLYQN